MALQAPTGTADLLPEMAYRWRMVQEKAEQVFGRYGYQPIETPTFEQLDVFVRGIGEATDVVGKEMFLVSSRERADIPQEETPAAEAAPSPAAPASSDLLALRPEMTAGVVRAVIQHGMLPPGASALKLYYAGPMFRHEKPQKGRLREFHQIGAECLGAAEPSADAEVIVMLMRFFAELGLPAGSLLLKLNSMGDAQCRPGFRQAVREFIVSHPDLCPDCRRRADTNPLRAFDCKNQSCQAILAEAPRITDALCPDCAEHYAEVKSLLAQAQVEFVEEPRLVRGLDYYTRTVFEVEATAGLGSQNAIGGGGRYDGLGEELGGKPTPGLGFSVGFERIVLALEAAAAPLPQLPQPAVYIASVDKSCRWAAIEQAARLRDAGIATELDHQGRSLKSQFKAADRLGVDWVVVIGPDELASGQATLRDMAGHDERQVALADLQATLTAIMLAQEE